MTQQVSRRSLLAGLGATTSALVGESAFAHSKRPFISPDNQRQLHPPKLVGPKFHLEISRKMFSADHKEQLGFCINGSIPAPTLHMQEGDEVEIVVQNNSDQPTTIHWHGFLVPADQDGVPGLSMAPIKPGKSFTYRFKIKQHGTYWYHSHFGVQELIGLFGAIIIKPKDTVLTQKKSYDHDWVVLLHDWSAASPGRIMSNLKMQPDYYNFHERTVFSLPSQAKKSHGYASALKSRLEWSGMNMSAHDILDVSGETYAYLVNGLSYKDQPWLGVAKKGEKVRLRFINAAAMSLFDVRMPGQPYKLIQADGQDIEPLDIDEFRFGPGETYDVEFTMGDKPVPIFAQAMDRTGYALGWVTNSPSNLGTVPKMDPMPVRTMRDMGMCMGDGDMKGMHMDGMDMPKDHHHSMKPMEMGDMSPMPSKEKQAIAKSMDLEVDDPGEPPVNVENQMVAKCPVSRLSDPGDGLEKLPRKVLNYAQLRSLNPSPRLWPTREIVLHLTGNMERFMWGFNGRKFSESGPIQVGHNECVRITLINDTMMEHPMHLHGFITRLENGQGQHMPHKHTILVQPGEKVSYVFNADTKGMWAFHCHLMLHMMAGMFRVVQVV